MVSRRHAISGGSQIRLRFDNVVRFLTAARKLVLKVPARFQGLYDIRNFE